MKVQKLIVMYPAPTCLAAFERLYNDDHMPMAEEKPAGKTRYDASLIRSNANQTLTQFHRFAEVSFPSLSELEDGLNSPGK